MSLPKLEVPTYTIKLESIKDTVTYRPFLVKEEKILLMALEGGDGEDILKAVQSILTTCIMESKINIPSLPTFDLEYQYTSKICRGNVNSINSLSRMRNTKAT